MIRNQHHHHRQNHHRATDILRLRKLTALGYSFKNKFSPPSQPRTTKTDDLTSKSLIKRLSWKNRNSQRRKHFSVAQQQSSMVTFDTTEPIDYYYLTIPPDWCVQNLKPESNRRRMTARDIFLEIEEMNKKKPDVNAINSFSTNDNLRDEQEQRGRFIISTINEVNKTTNQKTSS
jgi:hypothetical protein